MNTMNRQEIFAWCRRQYGTEPDYPWKDRNAVLRHTDNNKWYGVVLEVERGKLSLPGDGMVDVLNLKCDPILIGSLRTQPGYFPAYHMNKEKWISVQLDGPEPDEEVKQLIDLSYQLTQAKITQKKERNSEVLTSPDWNVYFDGNFWGHHGRDRAGREIAVEKEFSWAGRQWLIPAVYSCGKGLVVDFCMCVNAEEIRSFMKKWNLNWENDSCERFTREQLMKMELDNPLCLDFKPQLTLNNGRTLRASHGCAVSYNPCLTEQIVCEAEEKQAVDHYDLDASCGWVIYRYAFPWGCKRRPEIKTLSLTMEQRAAAIPGSSFRTSVPGDTVSFTYPANGKKYVLTVRNIEPQTVPEHCFTSERWEYPTHYCMMSYTIHPELPEGGLTVTDCAESDRPKERHPSSWESDSVSGAAAIGIIGGTDGPTAVCFSDEGHESLRTACSALHFAPVNNVEWRMIFHERQYENSDIELF